MRNNPIQSDLRKKCLAKTRNNTLCQAPSVKGKKRCRMHGGASGSGAPRGNKNAFKHGNYSRETLMRKAEVMQIIKQCKAFMQEPDF